MRYLRVKNWTEFQHYKDRNPPWIKLHRTLLDDYQFTSLKDRHKAHLMLLWILASQNDGRIPNDPKFLANRINANEAIDLELLIDGGFLLPDDEEEEKEKWPSRYVSAELRASVMERDGHKCVSCGAVDALEIDHKTPVSQGGKSEADNLQVLCRSCNRSKRVQTSEQFATQKSRSEEKRREETEKRREEAVSLIEFLNSKASRNYEPRGANLEFVLARLKDGATVEDCRAVIAKKCREWSADEKMSMYLRPATLFNREKFASYRGELVREAA